MVISLRWKFRLSDGRSLLVYASNAWRAEKKLRASIRQATVGGVDPWGHIEQDEQGRQHFVFPDDPKVEVDGAPPRESRK